MDRLQNGRLVEAADSGGFDVLITVDKNLRCQQNLSERRIAVVVLQPRIVEFRNLVPLAPQLTIAPERLQPGSFVVIRPEA